MTFVLRSLLATSNNNLTGSVPSGMTTLTYLNVVGNTNLTGSLDFLITMTRLAYVLGSQWTCGAPLILHAMPLPLPLLDWVVEEDVSLCRCSLVLQFPCLHWATLCFSVRLIEGYSNSFTGTLPTALSTLTRLSVFDVSNNPGLTGALPAAINQLSLLVKLSLASTGVGGSLPVSVTDLSALTYAAAFFV